jgi:hypothetical protein
MIDAGDSWVARIAGTKPNSRQVIIASVIVNPKTCQSRVRPTNSALFAVLMNVTIARLNA